MVQKTNQPTEQPRRRKVQNFVATGCLAVLATSAATLLVPSELEAGSCEPPCELRMKDGYVQCICEC